MLRGAAALAGMALGGLLGYGLALGLQARPLGQLVLAVLSGVFTAVGADALADEWQRGRRARARRGYLFPPAEQNQDVA